MFGRVNVEGVGLGTLPKAPDNSQKPQSLTGPFVYPLGSLPTVNKPYQFLWMSEHVFQLRCQVIGISQFEKDQILRTEVVQDPRGPRGDDGLALGQILKNARRRVEFTKSAPLIRDYITSQT